MTNVPSAVVLAGIRKTPGERRVGIHEAIFHTGGRGCCRGSREVTLTHTHFQSNGQPRQMQAGL